MRENPGAIAAPDSVRIVSTVSTVVDVEGAVRYRRLQMANLAQFGSCVHYWSPIEARLCRGQEVALLGAGHILLKMVVAPLSLNW